MNDRTWQLEHYRTYLEATPNKRGKTYAPRAIDTYVKAAEAFDRWLTDQGFEGGFELVSTGHINAYFSAYARRNSDSGAATRQMDLRSLFNMLLREGFMESHPYDTGRLNRYALADPVENIATIPDDLLQTMLKVTRGGSYLNVRDHAIVRAFLTGVRLEEMHSFDIADLDMQERTLSTIRLKGNRGRRVPFGAKTALAINRWLRTRATNTRYGFDPTKGPLWLADRNRPRLGPSGIYNMLRRRAVQAGYPASAIHPHMFRHTATDGWLDDGFSEGDVMRLNGWRSRSMVDRYAAHKAEQRAIKAARNAGWDDRWG